MALESSLEAPGINLRVGYPLTSNLLATSVYLVASTSAIITPYFFKSAANFIQIGAIS
jgi:hypothetical protein